MSLSISAILITKNEESCERLGFRFGSYRLGQTSALIRLLKRRTNSHVIGFYIGSGREIRNRMDAVYATGGNPNVAEITYQLALEFNAGTWTNPAL